jgi:multidrug efflux pump
MILSDVSVKRPVFATVLSLLLMAFGAISFTKLPLREYPDTDSAVVSVSTSYPGASSSVVETRVTEIIESRVSGIEGIRSITSQSYDGRSRINIEFNTNRNIDDAANDVRDRVSRVLNNLPEDADPPEVSKNDSDASPIGWITLQSSEFSLMDLTDYADRYIVDRLSTVDGVATIMRGGGGLRPAMRIWLRPQEMAARGITVTDIESALRTENVELPAGKLESTDREFTVNMERLYRTADDFRQLAIAKGDDGHIIRLGEIARVERAPEETRSYFHGNGVPTVGLGIVRQSQANTIDVIDGVNKVLEEMRPTLPAHMSIQIAHDDSVFIRAAIEEVYVTMGIAMLLVVFVIYLFLGSVRAMLIPAVVVPVCLTATFAVLYAFGFSINLLTLLALVLSIGLVVDDSIVVLENVYRRIEGGEAPLLAAYKGSSQVAFAIVATTTVLVAVFAPIAFAEGNTGRLFTELAATVSGAVIVSGVLALSLSPMMCSKLLKREATQTWLTRFVDRSFTKTSQAYRSTLNLLFDNSGWVVLGVVVCFFGIGVLLKVVPTEFAPREDQGRFNVLMRAPQGASFQYASEHMKVIEQRVLKLHDEGVAKTIINRVPGFGGSTGYSTGVTVVMLAPWGERPDGFQIMDQVQKELSDIPGVQVFPFMQQGLSGGGDQPVQFVIGGPSYDTLADWREIMLDAIAQNPKILNVQVDLQETKPQMRVSLDRNRAADLGVSVQDVGRTLDVLMGGRPITTYIENGEEYDVIVQAEDSNRERPSDVGNFYVRSSSSNDLIPLSNLVTLQERGDTNSRNRYNRLRAITISAQLADGYTLGEALTFLEDTVQQRLPSDAQIDYKGESREFKESSSTLYFTFALALVVVFLVLAAQFESFIHPVIIMFTVPLGLLGALLGLYLGHSSLNVYSQIGIIILIGISAKNGILIVEFANQLRDEGRNFRDALLEASAIRLRPIIMTSVATIMGAVPLIMATGAGAQSRFSIGIVVFSGVLLATILTVFVVPTFYYILGRYTGSPSAVAKRLTALEDHDRKKTAREAGYKPSLGAGE